MQLLFISAIFISMLVLLHILECYTAKKLAQYGKYQLRYLTAIIGTPVHELSHALFCILSRHKINEIKLLQFNGSHTLGYVRHSYNPKSIYQQCGRFFIGIAPIIGGLLSVVLLSVSLYPDYDFSRNFYKNQTELMAISYFSDYLNLFVKNFIHSIEVQNELIHQSTIKFSLWFFITASIICHITPSSADMKGAASGAIFLSIVLITLYFLVDIEFYIMVLSGVTLLLSILTFFFFVMTSYLMLIIVIAKLLP